MTSKPKKPSDIAVPVGRKGELVDPGEPNDGFIIRDEVKYARRYEQEKRDRRVSERRRNPRVHDESAVPREPIPVEHRPTNGITPGDNNGEHEGEEA